MRIHVVDSFTSSEHIRAFHYGMFHGRYEDESQSTPMANRGVGEDFTVPVRLVRNGWRIPDVFMPANTFVVSAEVLDLFLDVKHIAIRPVEFAKLIDVPYFTDDFSFYRSEEYLADPIEADVLFDRLPDVPEHHRRAGRYYELIGPRIKDVIGSFPNTKTVNVRVPYCIDTHALQLSEAMVAEYPILWSGYTVLNDDAFGRLAPYLDWDYFAQVEIDL